MSGGSRIRIRAVSTQKMRSHVQVSGYPGVLLMLEAVFIGVKKTVYTPIRREVGTRLPGYLDTRRSGLVFELPCSTLLITAGQRGANAHS